MLDNGKTEKPTPKRISDARHKGQVVRSQDFNGGLVLATGSIILACYGSYWGHTLRDILTHTLTTQLTQTQPITLDTLMPLLGHYASLTGQMVVPLGVGLMVMAIVANMVTVGLIFTTEPLQLHFDAMNPVTGTKRLFAPEKLMEVAKSLLKLLIVAGVLWGTVQGTMQKLLTWFMMPPGQVIMEGIWPTVAYVLIWASSCLLVIGVIDWQWTRHQYIKKLMMSRQEVIDEHKNSDGDPKTKARVRRMGREMIQKKQLAAVPKADVIINNPTHFSVAIQYDPDICPAPRVIAKGEDHFALQIREIAKTHHVPMVENKPLAQSLYRTVEVDHMIPPELFVAVAEVLAYVYSKNKGRKR
jgi:flagellar biosynthesis protein FlhB